MNMTAKDLVDAKLYPSQEAVIRDALRSLLQERPQLRIELAVHNYQNQSISLAKAAHIAGLSFDGMKEILVSRGIQLRLGPQDEQEAMEEVESMEHILAGSRAQ